MVIGLLEADSVGRTEESANCIERHLFHTLVKKKKMKFMNYGGSITPHHHLRTLLLWNTHFFTYMLRMFDVIYACIIFILSYKFRGANWIGCIHL